MNSARHNDDNDGMRLNTEMLLWKLQKTFYGNHAAKSF